MQEKVLTNKKNGMVALVLISLLYLIATVATVYGIIQSEQGAGT